MQHGAEPDQASQDGSTCLLGAVADGFTEVARALIKGGANVNIKTTGSGIQGSGFVGGNSPIIFAAQNSQVEAVRLLIEASADVNTEDYNRATALTFACNDRPAEIVRILLEAGALTNTTAQQHHPNNDVR